MSEKRKHYKFVDGYFIDCLNGTKYDSQDFDDMKCIETIFNAVINYANKQYVEKEEYKQKLSKIEGIIDNRLDDKVVPHWPNNQELFVEEKVGYAYALSQLKKKLKREGLLLSNDDEEDESDGENYSFAKGGNNNEY